MCEVFVDGIEIWSDEESDKNDTNAPNDEEDESETFRRRVFEGLYDFQKVITKWKKYKPDWNVLYPEMRKSKK